MEEFSILPHFRSKSGRHSLIFKIGYRSLLEIYLSSESLRQGVKDMVIYVMKFVLLLFEDLLKMLHFLFSKKSVSFPGGKSVRGIEWMCKCVYLCLCFCVCLYVCFSLLL